MGNRSFLIITHNNPEKYVINWDAINKEKMNHIIEESAIPQLQTLNDLAHYWDDCKLIGYMDEEYVAAIKEICEHTTGPEDATASPRLFYDVELYGLMGYVEFDVRNNEVYIGTYDYLPECDTDDYDTMCVITQRLLKELPDRTYGWTVHKL
jgi:hypothetical protein